MVRHNLRILTAKVVPLKPSYFYNVSKEEAKEYPSYSDAFLPLKGSQRDYLARGKYTYKKMTRVLSSSYDSIVNERKKLKREMASESK